MDDVLDLVAGAAERDLSPGESLIVDGEPSQHLYVLLAGTVHVQKHGTVVAVVSERGACIGEMGLLLGTPATADVIAVEPTRVARVEDAAALFEREPRLVLAVARLLATRLHTMTTYLVDLKEQYADHEGGLGMVDVVLTSLMRQSGSRTKLASARDPEPEY